MKLSIVIPAYKVERYIRKTIMSIFTQDCDLSLVEVIVINDGSPDRSLEVVKTIMDEGYPINLIDQENQGLSVARNNGIDLATGEYVWFVDSDDWIAPGCLKDIIGRLDGEVDILNFGTYRVADDETTIVGKNISARGKNSVLTGPEAFIQGVAHIATAQLSIYRRDFLNQNKLRFMKGIYHEDFEFCPRASYLSHKIAIVDEYYYNQRVNVAGIMHSINPKRSYDYVTAAHSLINFVKACNINNKTITKRFNYYIAMALNNAFDNINNCPENDVYDFNMALKNSADILKSFIYSGCFKYILEGIIFFLWGRDYSKIYETLKSKL